MTPSRVQRARRGVLVTLVAAALAGAALAAAGPPVLHASAATSSSSTPATPGFAVSQAVDSVSGNIYVAAQGPGHALYFYWDLSGTWYGPLAVGGSGTTFSAPSMTIDSSHHVVIAARGPGNALYFYWNINGTWHGPLQVGSAGNDVSTPSLTTDYDGNLDIAVQSPGQSLSFYWNTASAWYGPAGLGAGGKTLSNPSATSVSDGSGNHYVIVSAEGPNNSLILYTDTNGTWSAPAQSNAQTTFAAPSAALPVSGGSAAQYFYVRGAGDDLDQWEWLPGSPPHAFGFYPVGPGDVTGSAPAALDENAVTALGPSNSLYFYWFGGGGWRGPLGVGAAGSSFSIPSIAEKVPNSSNNPSIAVEGPGNTLYFYWELGGTWYGPLGIGAPGSTFSSAS